MQADLKESVSLTRQTMEEARATLEGFQGTLENVDLLIDDSRGLVQGMDGLVEDATGLMDDAEGALNMVNNFGGSIESRARPWLRLRSSWRVSWYDRFTPGPNQLGRTDPFPAPRTAT